MRIWTGLALALSFTSVTSLAEAACRPNDWACMAAEAAAGVATSKAADKALQDAGKIFERGGRDLQSWSDRNQPRKLLQQPEATPPGRSFRFVPISQQKIFPLLVPEHTA